MWLLWVTLIFPRTRWPPSRCRLLALSRGSVRAGVSVPSVGPAFASGQLGVGIGWFALLMFWAGARLDCLVEYIKSQEGRTEKDGEIRGL